MIKYFCLVPLLLLKTVDTEVTSSQGCVSISCDSTYNSVDEAPAISAPHLSSQTPLSLFQRPASPNLVSTVTQYCSTVLWNLGKCFVRVFRLHTGRLLSATSCVYRQQTSSCFSHPVQKIQTDSDLSDDEEQRECWQPQTRLLNHFLAVWKMNFCVTTSFHAFECAVHSSHILGYVLTNRTTFTTPGRELEASSRRTARHGCNRQTDGQTWPQCCSSRPPPLKYINQRPTFYLSSKPFPLYFFSPFCHSTHSHNPPLSLPIIPSSCSHLALTFQTARPQLVNPGWRTTH